MNGSAIELLLLAGIALFFIFRLRNVLGTRDGFEKPPVPQQSAHPRPDLEVIEGGPDRDITDHVGEGTPAASALAQMKTAEPSFSVTEFLSGARQAYEWIFMAFERGDLDEIEDFLAADVSEAFRQVVEQRHSQGLKIDAEFIGMRETKLKRAVFDPDTKEARISVSFEAEITSVVTDATGAIVEGQRDEIRKQQDIWVFARKMGSDDPNWILIATDD